MAIQVMEELRIDIAAQTSKHLREFTHENFDYIITVCDNAARNCPVFSGQGIRLHWPFDDPAEASGNEAEILTVFRRVRDEIGTRVREWLASNQLMSFDDSIHT